MAYGNEIMRVCRLENGIEVEVYEPAPVTNKTKGSCCGVGPEPWKAYAFESDEAAGAFITEKLPSLSRKSDKDEYNDTFNEVTKV